MTGKMLWWGGSLRITSPALMTLGRKTEEESCMSSSGETITCYKSETSPGSRVGYVYLDLQCLVLSFAIGYLRGPKVGIQGLSSILPVKGKCQASTSYSFLPPYFCSILLVNQASSRCI